MAEVEPRRMGIIPAPRGDENGRHCHNVAAGERCEHGDRAVAPVKDEPWRLVEAAVILWGAEEDDWHDDWRLLSELCLPAQQVLVPTWSGWWGTPEQGGSDIGDL